MTGQILLSMDKLESMINQNRLRLVQDERARLERIEARRHAELLKMFDPRQTNKRKDGVVCH